jgi:glycosyltransferase involved in cell wall biosynthesis
MSNLVSVIIPLYNRERYIVDALESIARQSYCQVEVIIVDDGSADRSPEVARECLHAHGLKGTVITIPNSGPDAARDFGITLAKGEFLAFLDSDDYFLPDYLEKMVGSLNRFQVEWAFCDFYLTEFDLTPTDRKSSQLKKLFTVARELENGTYLLETGVLFSYLLQEQPIFPSGMVIRRSLYDRLGSFTKLIPERILSLELEFLLRSARVAPALYLHDPLVYIRKHDDNISGKVIKQEEGEVAVLKTVLSAYDLSGAEDALVRFEIAGRCWNVGYFYYAQGELARSRAWFRDSFRHKVNLQNASFLAASFLPAALNMFARRCKALLK